MDKKKLIMGGVAVILIAGGVFLFTGKSSKGGISALISAWRKMTSLSGSPLPRAVRT